jgi:hypothetical protein
MKKTIISIATFIVISFLLVSCDEEPDTPLFSKFNDVKIAVKFGNSKSGSMLKSADIPLTTETPQDYYIALKSATLIGTDDTEDFEIFNNSSLASSLIYEFTDNDNKLSILQGEDIPEGNFTAIKLEIYYLQMNISISTQDRGVERRNFRIYLSDDAETEGGEHQPGDMTQINNGTEIGWLLGEGQAPNMDPVTPRVSAYTHQGDGVSWYNFAGKSGQNYGPFGDVNFMNSIPHPVYYQNINFSFESLTGETMIIEFDVEGCWQFEDKDNDGSFGYGDLDPINPTGWHMALPNALISFE